MHIKKESLDSFHQWLCVCKKSRWSDNQFTRCCSSKNPAILLGENHAWLKLSKKRVLESFWDGCVCTQTNRNDSANISDNTADQKSNKKIGWQPCLPSTLS